MTTETNPDALIFLSGKVSEFSGKKAQLRVHNPNQGLPAKCYLHPEEARHGILLHNLEWIGGAEPPSLDFVMQMKEEDSQTGLRLGAGATQEVLSNHWVVLNLTGEVQHFPTGFRQVDGWNLPPNQFLCQLVAEKFDNGFFPKKSPVIKKATLLIRIAKDKAAIAAAESAIERHTKSLAEWEHQLTQIDTT